MFGELELAVVEGEEPPDGAEEPEDGIPEPEGGELEEVSGLELVVPEPPVLGAGAETATLTGGA